MRVRAVLIAAVVLVAAGVVFLPGRAPRKRASSLPQGSVSSVELARLHDVIVLRELEFVRPGRSLIWAQEIATRPVSLQLYLVIGEEARRIRDPDELVGHVSVDTEESAMQYARLFTGYSVAPDGASDWREVWLEGDPEFAKRYGGGSYTPGGLREVEWKANHLSLPSVRWGNGTFVVERCLLAGKDLHHLETSTTYRVQDTVYPDGRMTRRALKKQELTVKIHVPGRM